MLAPDPHQLARVRPDTLKNYRRYLSAFVCWYVERGLQWRYIPDLDALLVEYKNSPLARVTKSKFQNLVAAVELLIPWAKRNLPWGRTRSYTDGESPRA